MNEKIEKAKQCAELLTEDLHDISKWATAKQNDALYVLASDLIAKAVKIQLTLGRLERV